MSDYNPVRDAYRIYQGAPQPPMPPMGYPMNNPQRPIETSPGLPQEAARQGVVQGVPQSLAPVIGVPASSPYPRVNAPEPSAPIYQPMNAPHYIQAAPIQQPQHPMNAPQYMHAAPIQQPMSPINAPQYIQAAPMQQPAVNRPMQQSLQPITTTSGRQVWPIRLDAEIDYGPEADVDVKNVEQICGFNCTNYNLLVPESDANKIVVRCKEAYALSVGCYKPKHGIIEGDTPNYSLNWKDDSIVAEVVPREAIEQFMEGLTQVMNPILTKV